MKAADESHAEVGDKANDAVRVNGAQVRATVIGEGGNLGLTQRGRIEYDLLGGRVVGDARQARLCTDFIDNSAGVDCSDHEVNIKILLGAAINDGELDRPERDALLVQMTDEVADLVLQDNYHQARTLGGSRAQALPLLPVHRRMITDMERTGQLDRAIEALPADEELEARGMTGRGLTSPELAVMLAYTKIIAEREITDSDLPDDPWTDGVVSAYFPTPLRERFADRMRPIRCGANWSPPRWSTRPSTGVASRSCIEEVEETGVSSADLIRAYVVVRDVFDLPPLWQAIESPDNHVPTSAQTSLQLRTRRLHRPGRALAGDQPPVADRRHR